MIEQTLRDWYILIVEDELMLADDLRAGLSEAGAIVIGPVGTLQSALSKIQREELIDGAILDVNLHGAKSFPAADLLVQRDVPFIFTTGYDDRSIPPRFDHVLRCEKPYTLTKLKDVIVRAIEGEAETSPPG